MLPGQKIHSEQPLHFKWRKPQLRSGKSWFNCQAGKKQNPVFDETMILERKDGSLLMFARDRSPLFVKCESPDLKGTQWSDGTFTNIVNAGSRFFLRRLKSGRILPMRSVTPSSKPGMKSGKMRFSGKPAAYKKFIKKIQAQTFPRKIY